MSYEKPNRATRCNSVRSGPHAANPHFRSCLAWTVDPLRQTGGAADHCVGLPRSELSIFERNHRGTVGTTCRVLSSTVEPDNRDRVIHSFGVLRIELVDNLQNLLSQIRRRSHTWDPWGHPNVDVCDPAHDYLMGRFGQPCVAAA